MSHKAAHRPADLEAKFQGELRGANGYQYWATSEEDEEKADFGDMAKRAELKATPKPKAARPKGLGRRLFRRALVLFTLLLLALLAYFVFNFVQVFMAAGEDQTREADAVIVLGAAQFDGTPSPVFENRLDHAYNLWNNDQAGVIITTGSKQEGDTFTEGIAGYRYLLQRGVPEESLLAVVDGGNTYQQLTASALQIEEMELETVLLVSDSYHNYRLIDIADEIGIEAFVSPTDVEPSIMQYMRESIAVSAARISGYRRLSDATQ